MLVYAKLQIPPRNNHCQFFSIFAIYDPQKQIFMRKYPPSKMNSLNCARLKVFRWVKYVIRKIHYSLGRFAPA